MSPARRKILYAVSFEVIGVLVAGTFLRLMSAAEAGQTFSLAALAATLAMVWSYAFNTLFEAWEARQSARTRTRARRAAHALLFEGGLLALLLPLTAWWLSVTLWQALVLEGWLVAIFIAYTYLFTVGFDLAFGPPQSAL